MEEIIKFGIENGLGVASFLLLALYVYFDKKQVSEEKKASNDFIQNMVKALDNNTETLKMVNDNQKEMSTTLERLTYKIEIIENKMNNKGD